MTFHAQIEPFAARLQCLRCGTQRWQRAGEKTACPGCEPNGPKRVLVDGVEMTEMPVAAVLAP